MALRSLSSVAVRNLARRRGRYLLTASGTALGVAVLFAVQVMSGATNSALDRAVNGAAGKSDVVARPIGSFDATLAPSTEAAIKARPDVEQVVSSTGFRSAVANPNKPLKPDESPRIAFVVGIDRAADEQIRSYEVKSGRMFTDGADEAVIGNHVAKTVGARAGDHILLAAPSGQLSIAVSGVLATAGAGNASSGDIVYIPKSVAQRVLAKGPVINGLDIVLRDGVDAQKWIDANQDALGDVSLTKSSDVEAGFRTFIAAVNAALTLASAIALFVGGFLIFLTFSLAVAERTRTYGTMRALGALPRQVRGVVVREAAWLGLASSLGGLVLGYGLAALAVQLVSSLLDLRLPSLGLPVGPAIFSVIVGVLISVVAAWLPGRRAAALSPVTAMREGGLRDEKAGRPVIGAVLVGVGIALVFVTAHSSARILPTLFVLFGAVLLVPIVLSPLARFLGVLTQRIARGVGAIAVMHLVKERSRSAYTLALLMVVLAMTFSIGTSNVSMSRTVDKVIERQGGGAIQVGAPGALDPRVEKELLAFDGVKASSPLVFGLIDIVDKGAPPDEFFTMLDPATYFDIGGFPWVDGDDASAKAGLEKGGVIILPEQQASRLKVKRGGVVHVRTTAGVKPFTLVATYGQIGNYFGPGISVRDAALFGTGRPNAFLLSVKDGVNTHVLRDQIRTALRPKYNLEVQTTDDIKEQAHAQLQGFFALAYALLAVAGLVGILGLANTMVVSVLTRTREVGMLRSTGTLRRQARAMVLVESATLALVAYVLSLPLGWLLSTGIVVSQRSALGFTIDYVYAWPLLPVLILVAIIVAGVAALIPARRIGRLEIVDALRFE
jgi:putative ABC transport system permease protein